MSRKTESDTERRVRQIRERQARLDTRSTNRVGRELLKKQKHRQSWIKPWLHACRHIRAYPVYERETIFHNYIPLSRLPRSLLELSPGKSVTPIKRLRQSKRLVKGVLGTPLGVYATSVESSESDSSPSKVTSPRKGRFKFSPKSLFVSRTGHGNTSEPSSSEPIAGTEETNLQTNSPIVELGGILIATMATTSTAAPGSVPALGPVPPAAPSVPIAMQMGAVGDRTTSVAPLPTFSGWPSADPDQHLSQFLMACIANNGRTEDVWLRWLPATLKDTAFEWYNRQPAGSFPNWDPLREAFLLHFRPIGFEDQLREQLMRSHMIPGEAIESYYGRVAHILRRWPNNQLLENFILSILINGLYPPELKMFVKENQLASIALSLTRAKVRKECHYDRILNPGSTLILATRTKFPNMSLATEGFQGMVLPTTNSNIATQPVLNPVPLQTLPPSMAITYPPYNLYQPQTVASQELPVVPIPKETNESLLLNLTKKMEELAVNMAKDKEKRPKQTQFRTNIWCTNCKGQGHMVQDCPSPPNMKLMCTNCGGKHPTYSCWNLTKQPHINNPTMIPAMPWDVNQVQGKQRYGWSGNRYNNQNRNFSNNQGYDQNNQSYGSNQNNYQGPGTVPEALQIGQPGGFTKATWNTPSRYIPVETPSMSNGMGRRSLHCFRCHQLGYFARDCLNPAYNEDYAPVCGNCKQSDHTTEQCNAPFNFNNRNQQIQNTNPVEDKTRTLQESPVNCVEVVRAVQT